METNIEDVFLESLGMTLLALEHKVGHELHLHIDDTCALAFLTPSAIGIEREVL